MINSVAAIFSSAHAVPSVQIVGTCTKRSSRQTPRTERLGRSRILAWVNSLIVRVGSLGIKSS